MAKSIISSFSVAFKKATEITEDVAEAKKEHRQSLKELITKYKEDVTSGKAEGIRTAKELVEVIKLDLLLMGEATDRTDNISNPIDDAQITKITSMIDENNPEIQNLISSMFDSLNGVNDSLDTSNIQDSERAILEEGTEEAPSIEESAESATSEEE